MSLQRSQKHSNVSVSNFSPVWTGASLPNNNASFLNRNITVDLSEAPSSESVAEDMKTFEASRLATSALLDSYLVVDGVNSNKATNSKERLKNLSKPLERNKYTKTQNPIVSTNHIGRQRPPSAGTKKHSANSLDSPPKSSEKSINFRSNVDTIFQLSFQASNSNQYNSSNICTTPIRAASTTGSALYAHQLISGDGNNSTSVCNDSFRGWIKSNQNWRSGSNQKSLDKSKHADEEARRNSIPRLHKRSEHMTQLYQTKLKEYNETYKETAKLKAFLMEKQNCTYSPQINQKTLEIVRKRDEEKASRSSDLAIIAPYCGPAKDKIPVLKRKTVPFVGLNQSKKSQANASSSLTLENGDVSTTEQALSQPTSHSASQLNNQDLCNEPKTSNSMIDNGIDTTASGSENSTAADMVRGRVQNSNSVSRRTRSMSPRMAYTVEKIPTFDAFAIRDDAMSSPPKVAFGCSSYRTNSRTNGSQLETKQQKKLVGDDGCVEFYVTPRVSSPTFFREGRCLVDKEKIKPYYRSSSETREVKNHSYMLPESKRMIEGSGETFTDRIMASVEKYYTHISVQKQLRKNLYNDNNDNLLLASIQAKEGATSGIILGPGQYNRLDIPGSGGVASESPSGTKGYSFSKLPRHANVPITRERKSTVGVTGKDWKTSLAKSGAPIAGH